MPRPVDTSSETFRKTLIIGGIAVGVAAVVGIGALVGFSSSAQQNTESSSTSNNESSGEQVSLVNEEQADEDAASSLKVEALDKLKFLDRDAQSTFKQALYEYCKTNKIELSSPEILTSSETEKKATAAKIVIKANASDYLICYWVANTSSPFMFEQATSSQVSAATSTDDDSEDEDDDSATTVDPQTGNTDSTDTDDEDDTSNASTSSTSSNSSTNRTSSNTTSSSSSKSSSSGSSSNSKSSSKAKTGRTSSAKTPVKASESEKLAKKLPEKAAYYLPTVIENYLSKKGFTVDGTTATIDYPSIKKSSVGYALYGYVTDDSGDKHYLDMEWNTKKEKFGINTYTKD